MGSASRILIKVQSSTFVSCLIFKMSLENTSAEHQSAFSVTFLFCLVTLFLLMVCSLQFH